MCAAYSMRRFCSKFVFEHGPRMMREDTVQRIQTSGRRMMRRVVQTHQGLARRSFGSFDEWLEDFKKWGHHSQELSHRILWEANLSKLIMGAGLSLFS